MASLVYDSFRRDILNGTIDLDTHDIRVALVTASYTPDQAVHDTYSDITNEVSNGNGYATGGELVGTPAVTVNTTSHVSKFDGDDVQWTSSTITARGAVLYDDTVVSPAKPLIGYIDFGANYSSVAGTFKIQWHTDGILTLT